MPTLERSVHVVRQPPFPLALPLRLYRETLQGLHRGHGFHQIGLVVSTQRKLVFKLLAQQRRDQRRGAKEHRQCNDHHQGQRHAVIKHDGQIDKGKQQIEPTRQRLAGQEVARVFQFAHTRHGVATAPALEVGQRQVQQMPEQLGAQLDIDTVRGVAHQIMPHGTQGNLEDAHAQEREHHHLQRGERAVREHLVDHHLKDQRRDQGDDLHEQRSQQNLAHQALVFFQRLPKPADTKAGLVRRTVATLGCM